MSVHPQPTKNDFSTSQKTSLVIPSQKLNWATWKQIFRKTFVEFCNETNLHGLSKIYDRNDNTGHSKMMKFLQRTSRTLWTCFFITGLALAIYLFGIVLNRYNNTPTIISVETMNHPISEVHFPGVSICNVNCVWKPNTPRIVEKLLAHNVSQIMISYFFGNLSALVNMEIVNNDIFPVFDILEKNWNYTPSKIMQELAMPCNKFIRFCKWMGQIVNCALIFQMETSELGYCCKFKIRKNSLFDIRVAGAGEDVGLKVLINIDKNNYVAARKYFYGAEVIMFDKNDFPQKHYISNIVQPKHGVAVAIKPSVITTSEAVSSFPVDLRYCLYNYERKLKITEKYTFESCIVECRVLAMIKLCKCIPFMYPDEDYTNDKVGVHQCGFRDSECLSHNKHIFYSIQPPENMYAVLNISKEGLDCDCLPSCHVTIYNDEIYPLDLTQMDMINKEIGDPNLFEQVALVKVYYKELSCIKYIRRIFMTWDDLLASFGGIFGLCLGASVFSAIEIGYYFTINFFERVLYGKSQLNERRKNETAKNFMVPFYKIHKQEGPVENSNLTKTKNGIISVSKSKSNLPVKSHTKS